MIHVHTNRSDGLSSPDEIAAAAARAGLKFVVFTDHGDATRKPDPPRYLSGVLCLDGVEISTTGGHYIALDMPASPYPLGGEPRDVVDDVKRMGGFGIVAHPDSPRTSCAGATGPPRSTPSRSSTSIRPGDSARPAHRGVSVSTSPGGCSHILSVQQ